MGDELYNEGGGNLGPPPLEYDLDALKAGAEEIRDNIAALEAGVVRQKKKLLEYEVLIAQHEQLLALHEQGKQKGNGR